MNSSTLSAVVEISHTGASWVQTPARPWPAFVRLSGRTTSDEVSLIVHTLTIYNSHLNNRLNLSPEHLIKATELVLPGGLAASDDAHAIYPSCCTGLEEWPNWFDLLSGSKQPWLGHDPSPFIESSDDGFLVWPDGGCGEPMPDRNEAIVFTRTDLESALASVKNDLHDFVIQLQSWCLANVPQYADAIVNLFSRFFKLQ